MSNYYNSRAPKKPTSLTVNSDLLRIAKELHINISAVLEQSLAEQVRLQKSEEWLEQNKTRIVKYNAEVEQHGCFSDSFRSF